jgi:hypothetical protein
MRKCLLIGAVLALAACSTSYNVAIKEGASCASTYSTYLDKPWCSKSVVDGCKKTSAVIAADAFEKSFVKAQIAYTAAKADDSVTSEIKESYDSAKTSFCAYVNAL